MFHTGRDCSACQPLLFPTVKIESSMVKRQAREIRSLSTTAPSPQEKSEKGTLLLRFFLRGRGGCTQAKKSNVR